MRHLAEACRSLAWLKVRQIGATQELGWAGRLPGLRHRIAQSAAGKHGGAHRALELPLPVLASSAELQSAMAEVPMRSIEQDFLGVILMPTTFDGL